VHFRRKNTHRNSFPAPETQSFQHGSRFKPHVTREFLRQEAIVAHLEKSGERKKLTGSNKLKNVAWELA
jgi:hypothetical protein